MRDWSLAPGDPLYLTLAADARLSTPDYLNDHIWELTLGGGEPSALSLRTTFGLRAKAMRIFPRFRENGTMVNDPLDFALPPTIRRFHPNFLLMDYSPIPNLDVSAEYWVPASNTVSGRVTLVNRSNATRKLRFEICAILSPIEGQGIANRQMQMVNVLAGLTSGLFPVLFITGGPVPGDGPHASLALDLELGPGASRQFTWVQATTDDQQTSFELARQIAARPWEAERTRLEMVNRTQTVDVRTGDPDWDAALALSQSAGFSLLQSSNKQLSFPSFVSVRQPDNGFSPKGDGTDHPSSWAGQTPLEAYYLRSVLPASPVMEGVLKNFLSIQTEHGSIDGKPGLAGQRGRYLAAPMLAGLAWEIHKTKENNDFINEVYPYLLKFFRAWFTHENDEDNDGLPQWKHVWQSGFEDNPLFNAWHDWSMDVNISQVHSPSLEAMLYHEAACLIRMAERLENHESLAQLHERAAKLRKSIQIGWQAQTGLYHYRERDRDSSLGGKELVTHQGSGTLTPKLKFEGPIRLLIEVQTQGPGAKRPEIQIHQFVTKGPDETISGSDFHWRGHGGVYTTKKAYPKLSKVVIKDLNPDDTLRISTLDVSSEDHTLLTPLWAGVPDEAHAQIMIGRAVLDTKRFDRPFGLPACPTLTAPEAESVSQAVHLPWNLLACEGLLRYGFRTEAARLFAHNMNAVIQNLKQNRAFHARYHAENGSGMGERNALSGLAPTGLFLKLLGVEIISASRVRIEGANPFPWDVALEYKGLKVIRRTTETEVIFLNGKAVKLTGSGPFTVEM